MAKIRARTPRDDDMDTLSAQNRVLNEQVEMLSESLLNTEKERQFAVNQLKIAYDENAKLRRMKHALEHQVTVLKEGIASRDKVIKAMEDFDKI